MSFLTCYALLCYLCGIAISEEQASIPKRLHKSFSDRHVDTVEFIDINGLDKCIDKRLELIGEGFGFLEGPKWIKDHLLFTEPFKDRIWQFSPRRNKFEIVAKYDKCGPTAIAWHTTFPDEIWIACYLEGSILRVDTKKYRIEQKLDYNNYADHDDIGFMPNDIVIDPDGNVYFTDMPAKRFREIPEDSTKTGGIYVIERGNMNEIKLVEHLEYGPNGIALSKDEEEAIVAVSNFIDQPLGTYDLETCHDRDDSKIYVRGYKRKEKNEAFMYFRTNDDEFHNYFTHNGKYDYFLDGSEFDTNNNFWQATFLRNKETNEMEGGQASIFKNNINGDSPEYIGSIRVHKKEMAFSNFENGGDGYMYATTGDFNAGIGTLLRIRVNDGRIKYVKKSDL